MAKPYPQRPRRPAKLAEWVARQIARDIAARRLAAGTKLPSEPEVVETFGVSRASVREAFRLLEDHGLITVRTGPGGGPQVSEITPTAFGRSATFAFEALGCTLRELAEVRLAIDPVQVRVAAEAQWPPGLARIKEWIAGDSDSSVDGANWLDRENDFHEALISATGNRILDLWAASVHRLYTDRVFLHGTYEERDETPMKHHHVDIGEAILRKDGNAAEEAMREHSMYVLEYARRQYPDLLEETLQWE